MQNIEIPSQGDLKTHVDSNNGYRTQLEQLQTSVQGITTDVAEAQAAQKDLTSAINSGRRSEVVRALLVLSSRSEFAGLRKQIEEARANIGGPVDATIVRSEQLVSGTAGVVENAYQRLPSWLRLPVLGTVIGGIGNVALAPVQGLLWLVRLRSAAEYVGNARKYLLIGGASLGAVAGLAKGGIDIYQRGGMSGLLPNRAPLGIESGGADALSVLDQSVRTSLGGITWSRDTNQIIIPAMPGIPVTEMRYQTSDGLSTSDLMHPDAAFDFARSNTLNLPADSKKTRLIIRYKLRGETTFREPPFIKDK